MTSNIDEDKNRKPAQTPDRRLHAIPDRKLDRREFAALAPALLGLAAAAPLLKAQAIPSSSSARPAGTLARLTSGTFSAGPAHNPAAQRVSRPFLAGTLPAGDLRLEIHESTQVTGAEHEAVETHLHNEIWCMREGVCELNINGVAHRMEAGEVGLVLAGDQHFIKNIGNAPCSYFVVAVGPQEG